ncbi:DUF397 domain-containing protein [Streptosporangium sp. NBC_01756]
MCLFWDATLALRDSKDPSGPVLFFNDSGWTAFLCARGPQG